MKKLLILLILVVTASYAEYTLTDEQRKQIIDQLKKDKQLIVYYQTKLGKLRKEQPKISYVVKDKGVVEETITIPVMNDNPLEYKSTFTIKVPEKVEWFPFDLMLCGMVETASLADVKLGITLVSLKPLNMPVLKNVRLNGLIGFRSIGGSLSYTLPEPFNNTSIHLYSGMSYKISETFGLGLSLFF